jgi:hypothetical protein
VLAAAFGIWKLYEKFNGPSSGRYTFSFTQVVKADDTAGCVKVSYYDKDYCIDEWSKVYKVMDKASQEISRTLNTTVKVEFDADYHKGSSIFTGDTPSPTIFLDKVFNTVGGHVKELVVGATCELLVTPLETPMTRVFDEETGLKLLS